MKKINIYIAISLTSLLLTMSCNRSKSKKPSIVSKECKTLYAYVYDSSTADFIKSSEYINTYYFNKSSIPYLSIKDYASSFLKDNNRYQRLGYTYSYNNGKTYLTLNNNNKYKAKATIDYDSQTITYDTYSGYFTNYVGSEYPLFPVINGGQYLYKDLKYNFKEGSTFTIDLSKYNIKCFNDNNELYLPYHVCLTAFNYNTPTLTYNGNGYYYIPSYDTTDEYLSIIKKERDAISNNAYNDEYMNYAYDHLAFTFDNFYGLEKREMRTGAKEEHTYFKDGAYASLKKHKNDLLSTNPDVSNEALHNFYNECVDDGGHSGYNDYNIYSTHKRTGSLSGDTGYTSLCYSKLTEERKKQGLNPSAFGDDFGGYIQTVNDVLFITMDEFYGRNDGQCKKEHFSDEEYGKCAVTILGRANKEVREHNNIKNVVFDMSCNTGGVGYMPIEILSWINKGNANFTVKNNNDGSILKGSGHADINLDGVFDDKDYLADDINVYFICSPVSFSSGNYVCCLASEVDNVKFIGDRSGGGSCNVASKPNAFGSTMYTSGYIQLCFNKEVDGKIISDEKGVTPTYYPISVDETAKFYDRDTISKKILGQIS